MSVSDNEPLTEDIDTSFDHLPPQQKAVHAYYKHGSIRAAARALGMAKSTISEHIKNAGISAKDETPLMVRDPDDKPLMGGEVTFEKPIQCPLPTKGKVKRYLITSAQNNTSAHHDFVKNMKAFANELNAEILVGTLNYNLSAYKRLQGSEKPGSHHNNATTDQTWFDQTIRDYVQDKPMELAPGLIWCGDLQILPTVKNPLSSFDDFRGTNSLIFPAPKIALKSIPTGKHEPTKMLYTTGSMTQRNYTHTKAGKHGSWHHVYGMLLVEVDSDGDWFVRQISADDTTGSFQDLNRRTSGGKVMYDAEVEVLTPGDIHVDHLGDDIVKALHDMIDELRPNQLHLHDCLDFQSRSHHHMKDPHKMFEKYTNDKECVSGELQRVVNFFYEVARDWMDIYVVHSNHDDHLRRWLKDNPAAYARDPVNAILFLTLQKRLYEAIRDKEKDFHLFEFAARQFGASEDIVFLREDTPDGHRVHDIECSYHGDSGPNGSRGSIANLAKSGNKVNIGHSHTAGIQHGAYQAGLMASFDLGYNTGPSSWSRSLILTYENGKRTIITMRGNKWRA